METMTYAGGGGGAVRGQILCVKMTSKSGPLEKFGRRSPGCHSTTHPRPGNGKPWPVPHCPPARGLCRTAPPPVSPVRPSSLSTSAPPDECLWRALRHVGLEDVLQGRGGLDAAVDTGGRNLSHGERQLLCLAHALVEQPGEGAEVPLLLCDEATANVDPETDAAVHTALLSLRHTVVAVCHRLQAIPRFDHVIVLERGRVAEQGPPGALLADPGSLLGRLYARSCR